MMYSKLKFITITQKRFFLGIVPPSPKLGMVVFLYSVFECFMVRLS